MNETRSSEALKQDISKENPERNMIITKIPTAAAMIAQHSFELRKLQFTFLHFIFILSPPHKKGLNKKSPKTFYVK